VIVVAALAAAVAPAVSAPLPAGPTAPAPAAVGAAIEARASATPSLRTDAGVRESHARRRAPGFSLPYVGTLRYRGLAPRVAANPGQVNRPLGRAATERIARGLGLDRTRTFTRKQYRLFVSGKGVGGDPASAKLVDESVRILTNTTGRPLVSNVDGQVTRTVLASYGLMVSTDGWLQSPANANAPTRQVNAVIEPGGYLGTWARANGAQDALRMLYRSAYTPEAVFGNRSQQQSGAAQLVPNTLGGGDWTVGISMAPSIWIVNFALIYVLNPDLAAKMPARWTPIPADVVQAIEASEDGRVPYSEYAASLTG
jgi:hypothetical protein